MKDDAAVRIYIVCLFLALAADVPLMPLPVLNVASVPFSFIVILAGAVFPLTRLGDFRNFVSHRKLLIALAALFLLSGALSAGLSPFPALFGLRWLARYAMFLMASFLLLFLFSLDTRRVAFFLKAWLGVALVLAMIALIEVASDGFSGFLAGVFREGSREFFSGRVRAAATLDHPNTLGCVMALAVLLAVYLRRKAALKTVVFYPAVVLAGAGLVFSGSRNALIMLMAPLAALLLNRKTIGAALPALGFSVLLLILLAPSGSRFAYLWRFADSAKPTAAGGEIHGGAVRASGDYDALGARKMLWRSSWAMFRDRPLFGVGPGGAGRAMKDYAPAELMAMDSEKIANEYLHAHNGMLNLLAEFGAVGALPALLILIGLARGAIRRYGFFPPGPEHALILALLISFVADAFFYSTFYMVTTAALLLLFGSSDEGGGRFRPAPATQADPHEQGQ